MSTIFTPSFVSAIGAPGGPSDENTQCPSDRVFANPAPGSNKELWIFDFDKVRLTERQRLRGPQIIIFQNTTPPGADRNSRETVREGIVLMYLTDGRVKCSLAHFKTFLKAYSDHHHSSGRHLGWSRGGYIRAGDTNPLPQQPKPAIPMSGSAVTLTELDRWQEKDLKGHAETLQIFLPGGYPKLEMDHRYKPSTLEVRQQHYDPKLASESVTLQYQRNDLDTSNNQSTEHGLSTDEVGLSTNDVKDGIEVFMTIADFDKFLDSYAGLHFHNGLLKGAETFDPNPPSRGFVGVL